MDLGLVVKLGESVFDTLVDRLTAGDITIHSAWLRPAAPASPLVQKIDVTVEFKRLLSSRGGVSIVEEPISPVDLLPRNTAHPKWYTLWLSRPRSPVLSAMPAPPSVNMEHQSANEIRVVNYWLCVLFSLPGGANFIACYLIPEERVTFPPALIDPKSIIPLNRQITAATMRAFVAAPQADPEEALALQLADVQNQADPEEEQVIVDFTKWAKMAAGPRGDFFSRQEFDLRVLLAEVFCAASHTILLDCTLKGMTIETTISYADGSETGVNACRFICTENPNIEEMD